MSLRSLTFMDLYRRNAWLYPQKPALVDNDQVIDFQALWDESRALQAGLAAAGIQPGDRIAVLAQNAYHFFPLFGAASDLGAILVLINRRLSTEEIREIVADTSPVMLITDVDIPDTAQELLKDSPGIVSHITFQGQGDGTYARLLQNGQSASAPPVRKPDVKDPFVIIHTAAVQGKPRGAVLSQENLILSALEVAAALKLDHNDGNLNILPIFHIMGINLALAVMLAGGKNLILPGFDPEQAVKQIRAHGATVLGTFPPILSKILETMRELNVAADSLKHVLGLEQPEIIAACQEKTGACFWSLYGQTETSGMITFAPYDHRPGSAGQPGKLVSIKVVDEFDRDLPPGETGEIVIQSPLVFQGYWQQPELTALAFRDDWHHTGDLGALGEGGFLFFKGRKPEKDLIKSGGENVFPVEVEKVILENPSVAEVSVIGVPDPTFGEGIKAVCVLKENHALSEQELIRFVGSSRIAGYKKPRFVAFVDSLPKAEDGSIDRARVKEIFGKR